jgi:hypothetical protein
MKLALAIVALVCLMAVAIVASAADVQGRVITLDDEDIQACADGDGCVIVTVKLLQELRKAAMSCLKDA